MHVRKIRKGKKKGKKEKKKKGNNEHTLPGIRTSIWCKLRIFRFKFERFVAETHRMGEEFPMLTKDVLSSSERPNGRQSSGSELQAARLWRSEGETVLTLPVPLCSFSYEFWQAFRVSNVIIWTTGNLRQSCLGTGLVWWGVSGVSFTPDQCTGQKLGVADSTCITVKSHSGQENRHTLGRK